MWMDYHLHSAFSGDGRSPVEDICAEAGRRGLTHIAITDHHDIGNAKYEIKEFETYLAELERCKRLFPGLDIARGLEMDYRRETWDEMKLIPERMGLDFALLSLHFVDGVDPYLPEYFDGRSQSEGYSHYLRELNSMIARTEGPWVLGHITYVSKFARFEHTKMEYSNYRDELDNTLRLAVEKGYGLEVNTSGIKNGAGLLPGSDILRRYRELGGEAVTTGSDAHCAEDAGRWIGEATEAVKAAGFRYMAVYKGLRPEYRKID